MNIKKIITHNINIRLIIVELRIIIDLYKFIIIRAKMYTGIFLY